MSGPPSRPLHYMACEDIADYLSNLGVSSQGVRAIRDNQVDGEMFMELTENDIKDLFSIFKDRHLVRKILQGKDNRPAHRSHPVSDFTSQPIRTQNNGSDTTSERISSKATVTSPETEINQRNSREYMVGDKNVTSGQQIHLLQSYVKAISPISPSSTYSTYYPGHTVETVSRDSDPSSRARVQDGGFSYTSSPAPLTSVDLTTSRSQKCTEANLYDGSQTSIKEFYSQHSNSVFRSPASVTASKDQSRPTFQSAISQFLHTRSQLSACESKTESPSRDRNSSSWANADDDKNDSQFIPSVLSYRLTQFSGLELMSRKAKQGRPNESQRLGQMVIREASSRAGIWDDPPCLQLLSAKQKQLFFEYAFMMAPNLREYRDLLWKRLGEALLNRRKYLRDKVLGKRGKRPDDSSASQEGDLDSCDSPELTDDFEDQIPDTSTSPVHRANPEEGSLRRAYWDRVPSSTVSRSDVDDYPVLVLDDSPDEDEKQAYPDSTMDNQSMTDSDTKLHVEADASRRKRSYLESNTNSSRNLSLLSSAACSALLKEEEEQGFRHEIKQSRISDSWMDFKEEDIEAGTDPPPDIEKVNLHKRLFLSKYDSSAKHHHGRTDVRKLETDRRPIVPVYETPPQPAKRLEAFVRKEEPPEISFSPENEDDISRQWDAFVIEEEVPHMRIYSTIDRGISHYTGEELLGKKSKQGKPSEPQRLGQQVIRESAMMAKLWQDVPQSIRSISEEQKKTFYQCAFTLAPNLIPCRDMLWRRLGEALQNRRKYVRDRSLGKRPTKREQRLMKESLQHQESESDSQASLSSIQDIENIVRIKTERPDSCYLKH